MSLLGGASHEFMVALCAVPTTSDGHPLPGVDSEEGTWFLGVIVLLFHDSYSISFILG